MRGVRRASKFAWVAVGWPLIWHGALFGQSRLAGRAADELDVAAFDAIVVGDFEDRATESSRFSGDTPEEIEEAKRVYEADLSIVRRNFSTLLIQELKRTEVFSEVLPIETPPTRRALLIEGEITQFDRGNLKTRFLIGMGAGRVRFDATVRVKDAKTGAEITVIEINRGSGLAGGAVGMSITAEYLMQRSAIKVASTLRNEKCSVVVCEEPRQLTVAAPKDADESAKQFDVAVAECLAYFYVSLPRDRGDRRGVEVWSDNSFLGVMDSEDGYFLWSLEYGNHEISARYLSKRLRRSVAIDCAGGEAVFIHHEVRSEMVERLLLEPVNEGRRDVRKRQLLLPQSVD
jgi:hypothetical protein